MGGGIRSFVAVEVSREVREEVRAFVEARGSGIRGLRWVKPENLHLTVKFLGDVPEGRLPEVGSALEEAAAGHCPLRLDFRGAGVFPPRGRPRIVWIDLAAGGAGMAALREDVERSLEPLGFPPETRPFSPHLTIGRARSLEDPAALTLALAEVGEKRWGASVADRVHLMRSDLFPTGPRYSILHEVRLTARRPDREENA